jgi:hypothetical protein
LCLESDNFIASELGENPEVEIETKRKLEK